MTGLLGLQGLKIFELNAMRSIIDFVGRGFGDGVTKFDCFISYRASSERALAVKLYEQLRLEDIHPFLDCFCLEPGLPWREGFMRGLFNSRKFLPLLSEQALGQVKDVDRDHRGDNFLMECQCALQVIFEDTFVFYL